MSPVMQARHHHCLLSSSALCLLRVSVQLAQQSRGPLLQKPPANPSPAVRASPAFHPPQVILNVLINSVKHTPEGGRITMDVDVVGGGTLLRVKVSDTGRGISADRLPGLSDPPKTGADMTLVGIGAPLPEARRARARDGRFKVSPHAFFFFRLHAAVIFPLNSCRAHLVPNTPSGSSLPSQEAASVAGGTADSAPAALAGQAAAACRAADPPMQYKMAGIDLYLGRSITLAMGGDLTAQSDGEGQGSVFTATMKLVEETAAVEAKKG